MNLMPWLLVVALLVVTVVLLYELSRARQRTAWAERDAELAATGVLTLGTYQHLAMRTAKPQEYRERLLHGALGACAEVGELATTVKAHVFYGKALDQRNVAEEVGDALWFLQLVATAAGLSMDDVATANVEKLRARYPHLYSNEAALARVDKGGA